MSFLDKFFNKKKEEPIRTNQDFWAWFKARERDFYTVIKEKGNIEEDFFNLLAPKLNQLRDGYWFLAGMLNDYMAELVITADGVVENIAFVEDLVNDAPHLPGWKITALKPALDIKDVSIQMGEFIFNKENLAFYANEDPKYPDEIDLTIVYKHFKEDAKDIITNGVFVFLDNYLGELRTVTVIDAIKISGDLQPEGELIPIEKLKEYLVWREKEFLEKYKGVRHNTENDQYVSLSAELENGNSLVAIVNTDLLEWDAKASHPWVMVISIKYEGDEGGMPDDDTNQILDAIEDEIVKNLKDFDGYLNIGRQTANHERELYFACRDFRKPSRLMSRIREEHKDVREIAFEIYKDKYWRSFNRFKPVA
jgi:hypothetical protein